MLRVYRRLRWVFIEAFFESANRFAEALAQFGQFFRPEHKQHNTHDDQQVKRLKESFKHFIFLQIRACRNFGAVPLSREKLF